MQGTLAAEVLTAPREVVAADGRSLKVRCSIASFSFSAHADYSQTSEFIEKLAPPHVVLCHGNPFEMDKLRTALSKNAAAQGMERTVHAPKVRRRGGACMARHLIWIWPRCVRPPHDESVPVMLPMFRSCCQLRDDPPAARPAAGVWRMPGPRCPQLIQTL